MPASHQLIASRNPLPPSLKMEADIRLFELLSRYQPETRIVQTLFNRHGVAPWEGYGVLVKEITRDGSNTIVSILMGQTENSYLEIVRAVADKLKAGYHRSEDEIAIERRCLESVLSRYLTTAPEEERYHIMKIIDETGVDFHVDELTRQLKVGALRVGTLALLIRKIGARATAQIVKQIISRIIGRQIAREASKRAAHLAGFAVPLLNVVMIGWTVWDLAGPAYRKTIPTVLEVALLRLERDGESELKDHPSGVYPDP